MEYDRDFNTDEKKINKCLLEAKDLKPQKKVNFLLFILSGSYLFN